MATIKLADALNQIKAQFALDIDAPISLTLTDVDTWYTLKGTDLSASKLNLFTVDTANGTVTYNGENNVTIYFGGSADLSSDDASNRVTLGLFKNGAVVPNETTPSDFTNQDRLKNVSIDSLVELQKGDVLTFRAKCNEAGTTVTFNSFHAVGIGKG